MYQLKKETLAQVLEMSFTEISFDRLVMTMPVGPKTHQPAGILHGGASVALAETAASVATAIQIDLTKFNPVGLEINANHLRSKKDGIVTATAIPLHKGRSTMVWDIKITDEQERLVCVSRCTMSILPKE
ncbi:PaaI family thioesterase [Alkalihalobacillus pseudalcaliphilus]|uniref:PaaI family thioesterase n=1 Tax=Alkalihalobacillus pseudalcaliphilus TaxID=79884 RepID=UPI00064DAD34|nr:PaaI family thioesterase [Alkalihalobacillus pseudalcaliphilus]KMK75367.1 esterase [Alkalihalobacillus pseudalcaliphilus]